MMQQLIVAVIVIAAIWVAASRLLPRALRAAIRRGAQALAAALGFTGLASRLAASSPASAGCGGCSGSGNCGPVKPSPQSSSISPEELRRTARR
jgi:hypothetical protein